MIGYIQQGINAYRRTQNQKHTIPASLFTQNEDFGFDVLPFDMLIEESHELAFDITDHNVENGAVISDHIIQRLRSVTVKGIFSNHSIKDKQLFNLNGNEVEGGDEIEIEGAQALLPVARDNYLELLKLAKSKAKVRVITALEVYDEMYIESVTAGRGADDGESVIFTIKLREIKKANTKWTTESGILKNPKNSNERMNAMQKSIGTEPAQQVEFMSKLTEQENMKAGS